MLPGTHVLLPHLHRREDPEVLLGQVTQDIDVQLHWVGWLWVSLTTAAPAAAAVAVADCVAAGRAAPCVNRPGGLIIMPE